MLTARVRRTLVERGLLQGAARVLVACSGGPDSQGLLHVLHALGPEQGFELVAAGVDHGLRAEAAGELGLARDLAQTLEVPFVTLRVQVPPGASRQAQARRSRYAALLECARQHGATRVAVGHTLDDQAETVLARILRGSSLEGLRAIAPLREDAVARPLIDARRADVNAYLAAHHIAAAHDPSNDDPRYLRVRVRQRLLPHLCAENPRLPEQLAALADDARDLGRTVAREVARARQRALPRIVDLREESGYIRRLVLKSLVEERTGSSLRRTHLAALERMLWGGGEVRLPGNLVATLGEQGELLLAPAPKRGRGMVRRTEGSD